MDKNEEERCETRKNGNHSRMSKMMAQTDEIFKHLLVLFTYYFRKIHGKQFFDENYNHKINFQC